MFFDRLELAVSLKIGSDVFEIPGGSMKRVRLDAFAYGFYAEVVFHISSEVEDDPVFAPFTGQDLIEASISIVADELPPGADDVEPLIFRGLATKRAVSEVTSDDLSGEPIVLRRYTLHFSDAANVLWRAHRPSVVYADSTMRAAIEAQTPAGLTVELDWTVLEAERKHLCIGFGDRETSFYDFLLAFIDRHGGVLEYDFTSGSYRIAGAKKSDGTPLPLIDEDIAVAQVIFPETPRHDLRLQNVFSESPKVVDLTQAQHADGVRRDILLRSPISTDLDRRGALETQKSAQPEEGLRLSFARYPRTTFRVHDLVELKDGFSARARTADKKYRIIGIEVRAKAARGSAPDQADLEEPSAEYELEVNATLELITNPKVSLPKFVAPFGPLYVEGKIVSLGGGEDDRTWMPIEDPQTSLNFYQVEIPLWNVKINVPFLPDFTTGHFFFPAYKKQRVLLAVDFETARIVRFLDWAANARLPQDSQGNRIALGKRAEDGTIVEHVYADGKPKLFIKRTLGQDLGTLEISEGYIKLEVKEDATATAVTPTYDVTMQVEAGAGTLQMQVGGSIADVSGKYEASSAGVTSAVAAAKTDLEGSLSGMETAMVGRIDAAKSSIEGASDSVQQTVDSVAAKTTSSKNEITTSASGIFSELQAGLAKSETSVTGFLGEGAQQVASLRAQLKTLGANITAPIDVLSTRATSTHSTLKSDIGGLRSDIERAAGAESAPLKKLSALTTDVADVDRALNAAFTRVRSSFEALATKTVQDWTSVDSAVTAKQQSAKSKLDRAKSDVTAKKSELETRLRTKNPPAAKRAQLAARIQTLSTAIDTTFTTGAANINDPLEAMKTQVAQQKSAARAPVDRVLAEMKSAQDGFSAQTGTLRSQIQTQDVSLRETIAAASNALLSPVNTFTSAVLDPLAGLSTSLAAAKKTLQEAVDEARAPLDEALATVEGQIRSADSALRPPITTARQAIAAADKQVQDLVKSANDALDGLLANGLGTVKSLLAQVRTIVDAAVSALEAIRELVLALKQTIIPPIVAVSARLSELKTIFDTVIGTLRSLLSGAVAALRAIPAEALPKALVQPALSAIESAISAAAPQIDTAAQQAGTQLSNIAGQIQQQVGTVKTQLVGTISSFTSSTTAQIDAVLPQVTAQLNAVKTQLSTAVAQIEAQIDNAKNAAVQAIQGTKTTIKTQVDGVLSTTESALQTARTALSQGTGAVKTQLDTAEKQLTARTQSVTAPVDAQLNTAKTKSGELVTSVRTSIKTIEDNAARTVDTFAAPVKTTVASAKTAIDQSAAAFEGRAAGVRTELARPVDAARAAIPADTALDSSVASLRSPIDRELAAIGREIDAS